MPTLSAGNHLKAMSIHPVKVMLASGSPRRRELMSQVFTNLTIAPDLHVDESVPESVPAMLVAEYAANKKLKAYRHICPDDTILVTADTVVVCNDTVLGKPADAESARHMLQMLGGNTHRVFTGVAISYRGCTISFSDVTHVHFVPLDDETIDYYIRHYRPFDKAGAYGIQEWIGYVGIDWIQGDYYNVMGLPLRRVYSLCADVVATTPV